MPENMGGDRFEDPGNLRPAADNKIDAVHRKRIAEPVDEKWIVPVVSPAILKIRLQGFERRISYRNDALLAALTVNPDRAAHKVHISNGQAAKFLTTNPAGIEKFKDRAVAFDKRARVLDASKDFLHFGFAQESRQSFLFLGNGKIKERVLF